MEEKALIRSNMVSRLPKFGGRSSSGGTSPLSNGSTQPTTTTQDGKTTPPGGTQPNSAIRASSFSLKWRKDEGMTLPSPLPSSSPAGDGGEDKAQMQLPSLTKEVKNGCPGTPKLRRSGLTIAASSPKSISKQLAKMSPKVGTKLEQSSMNGGPKISQNGSSIPPRTGSDPRLVRPRLGSSSPRSSSQDSLSQSSDSLKTLAMDSMVRSNSFTHFKQIPSPTNQPMTRSFSFNRAVELAKPLANTQLRPPKSSFLKPPQLSNGRVGLGLGGFNGSLGGSGGLSGGLQSSRNPPAASSKPTPSIPSAPTTPSALKKPLLPSGVLTKPLGGSGGSLGYRLTRPGHTKQQKPLFQGKVKGDQIRPSTAPEKLETATEATDEAVKGDSHSDSDGSCRDRRVKAGSVGQTAGETLEDMSLSSASSLDRVDTSEEILDDLDSVGDMFSDGDMTDNKTTGSATQTYLHSFLDDSIDWDTMDLAGHKEESPMQDSQGPLALSQEQGDAPQASSVELSPSNSSGGTYMWDEEGLEPLGGPGPHPLDNYDDSELNSLDILNNLDPRGSGELDDDDLMLDVDLPEDGLHDADTMSYNEQSERSGRQGQRRKHHRWSGPDHFHNNRSHVFQHYDGLKSSRISSRPVSSETRQYGYTSTLDDLTLQHMTQDCSSLKNQLLKLKALLQLEDPDCPADAPEETEDNTTTSQLEELFKEVQMLREELRSRDKTIAQLTLQCQQLQHQREQTSAQGRPGRCQCHQQRAPSSLRQSDGRQTDKRTQHRYDKATQTYWRAPNHAPPVLQPFNEHLHQGKVVKTRRIEGHSDLATSRSEEGTLIDAGRSLEGFTADVSGPADPDELSRFLGSHLRRPSSGAPQGVSAPEAPASAAQSAAQHEWRTPAAMPQNSTCPRMLQPPRLHKRVSLPALKPGASAASAGSSSPLSSGTKQLLPPPSRGLPCFNTGPQLQTLPPRRSSLLQPRRTSDSRRESTSSKSNPSEHERRSLKEPESAKILIPASRSGLPKPKIP